MLHLDLIWSFEVNLQDVKHLLLEDGLISETCALEASASRHITDSHDRFLTAINMCDTLEKI